MAKSVILGYQFDEDGKLLKSMESESLCKAVSNPLQKPISLHAVCGDFRFLINQKLVRLMFDALINGEDSVTVKLDDHCSLTFVNKTANNKREELMYAFGHTTYSDFLTALSLHTWSYQGVSKRTKFGNGTHEFDIVGPFKIAIHCLTFDTVSSLDVSKLPETDGCFYLILVAEEGHTWNFFKSGGSNDLSA